MWEFLLGLAIGSGLPRSRPYVRKRVSLTPSENFRYKIEAILAGVAFVLLCIFGGDVYSALIDLITTDSFLKTLLDNNKTLEIMLLLPWGLLLFLHTITRGFDALTGHKTTIEYIKEIV